MTFTKSKKAVLIFFCFLFLVFLLLFSYKAVLYFTDVTPTQKQVFNFLENKGELSEEYTKNEVSHLQDVKQVMKYADYALYALLLVITLTITYYKKDKQFVLKLFNYGGKVIVAAIILLGAFSLFFFEVMFTLFHKIFFPQGNWIFVPDSLLIQTFPLEFFIGISKNIFALTLVLGVLVLVIRRVMRK